MYAFLRKRTDPTQFMRKQSLATAVSAHKFDRPTQLLQAPIIQRLPACACGGGCPLCSHSSGELSKPEATPLVQRQLESEEEKGLQPKRKVDLGTAINQGHADRIQTLRGGGQPLTSSARRYFETRFGRDLSTVRIHTSSESAGMAKALNAQAFTTGRDVFFGEGKYAPGTRDGNTLLAHELTHTIQQGAAARSRAAPPIMRAPQSSGMGDKTADLSLLGSDIRKPAIFRHEGSIMAIIYFAQDSFLLDGPNLKMVESLGDELGMMRNPIVSVDGHASTEGDAEYNLNLSKMRSFGVETILRSKLVTSVNFKGEAHGEKDPTEPESAKSASELKGQRAQNRRVEILILPPLVSKPEKKINLKLPYKPETLEEKVERIIKEAPPDPIKKRSISELGWKKIDEVIDRYVPKDLRGLAKKAARSAAEKALDSALDAMGVSGDAKEAIKEAVKAGGQTIKP